MKKLFLLFFVILSSCNTAQKLENDRLNEINQYWREVERCVKQGDFQGYVNTIHDEGVLVSGTKKKSYPLAEALKKWKVEFDDTKSGKMQASVSFRFSQRFGDATTAHETGMFLYTQTLADGKRREEYIHFEALLIKKLDSWKIIMEYQKSVGTKAEWDKLPVKN